MKKKLKTTELSTIFKALSNSRRLEILAILNLPYSGFPNGTSSLGISVGAIALKTGLSQGSVSEFLAVLQRCGLVRSQRKGTFTYYVRDDAFIAGLGNFISSGL